MPVVRIKLNGPASFTYGPTRREFIAGISYDMSADEARVYADVRDLVVEGLPTDGSDLPARPPAPPRPSRPEISFEKIASTRPHGDVDLVPPVSPRRRGRPPKHK